MAYAIVDTLQNLPPCTSKSAIFIDDLVVLALFSPVKHLDSPLAHIPQTLGRSFTGTAQTLTDIYNEFEAIKSELDLAYPRTFLKLIKSTKMRLIRGNREIKAMGKEKHNLLEWCIAAYSMLVIPSSSTRLRTLDLGGQKGFGVWTIGLRGTLVPVPIVPPNPIHLLPPLLQERWPWRRDPHIFKPQAASPMTLLQSQLKLLKSKRTGGGRSRNTNSSNARQKRLKSWSEIRLEGESGELVETANENEECWLPGAWVIVGCGIAHALRRTCGNCKRERRRPPRIPRARTQLDSICTEAPSCNHGTSIAPSDQMNPPVCERERDLLNGWEYPAPLYLMPAPSSLLILDVSSRSHTSRWSVYVLGLSGFDCKGWSSCVDMGELSLRLKRSTPLLPFPPGLSIAQMQAVYPGLLITWM
ncbi:hypothetical protein DFP72DRAFT_860261 [Ephemerocybe angulata]|uniref:Uncharacterized protein n=1 Tax=Ephemerocybe angulata TaxID=980116 RepID=A0A8H6LVG6_9AGAR|nr:hypothetical protein DFP72DRAFT_860261 [Tulosesus angulatus]